MHLWLVLEVVPNAANLENAQFEALFSTLQAL
jgi:hypothetical protein